MGMKIGSSSETVDAHPLDQSLCGHGTVRSRSPEETLYGRRLVPHEYVLKIDADSQPVGALHLFGPDQACMDEDEAPVADRLFPVRSLERVEYMVDTEVSHDVYAYAPIVSVADRHELLQPLGRLLRDAVVVVMRIGIDIASQRCLQSHAAVVEDLDCRQTSASRHQIRTTRRYRT
jgi:hypothetical protein